MAVTEAATAATSSNAAAWIAAGSAAASTGASVASAGMTGHKGRKLMREMQKKSFDFQREQRDWNYQRYLEALEYDSPAAQYQRYLDAGLNPMYFMGENSSQPVATQNAPESNFTSPYDNVPESYRNPDLSQLAPTLNAAGNAILQGKELSLKRKELELKERGMYKNEELIDAKLLQMKKNNLLTDAQIEDLQSQVDTRVSQVELYRSSAEFQRAQARYQNIINGSMNERIRLEFKEKKATINQLISQYKLNFKSASFIAKQIDALNLEMYQKTFDAKVYQRLLIDKADEIAAAIKKGEIDLRDAELPGAIKSAEQKSTGWFVTLNNVLDLLGKFTGVAGNIYQFRGVNSQSQTQGNFNSSNLNHNFNYNMNNNGTTSWHNP